MVGVSNTTADGLAHAVLWDGTQATELGMLPGENNSHAYGINNAGQVVGDAAIASGQYAVLWTSGGNIINLNFKLTGSLALYVTVTEAVAINDNGWIVANGIDSRTDQVSAFLLEPSSVPPPIPLPSAAWLFVSGLGGLAALARRRRAAED